VSAGMARGLTFRNAGDGAGAQITVVEGGSVAAAAGLQAGDVVVEAGGAGVDGMAALARALQGATGAIDLTVTREGERTTISLPG
ncbi:PDZ domain-containing protein, partial [Brevundimonas sp. M-11_2]